MSNLLDTYEDMQKQAEVQKLVDARMETISKYATYAEDKLREEFGEDFTEDDVEKLASALLDNDISVDESQEKVAEFDEAGRVMARSFLSELESNSNSKE